MATSILQYGKVTAPGAGAAVATVALNRLVPGVTYKVTIYVYVDGTPTATNDDDNMQLLNNGASVSQLEFGVSNDNMRFQSFNVTIPVGAATGLVVQAIGAATAGAVYHVVMVVTSVSSDTPP